MGKKVLYISPSEFVELEPMTQQSLMKELATRDNVINFMISGTYLPNPDPILRKLGRAVDVYKDLRADSHIGSCILSRNAGVRKLIWDISPENAPGPVFDFIEDVFKRRVKVRKLITEMLEAAWYGFKPLEIVWEIVDGKLVPNRIAGKPSDWFVFDRDGKLRLITQTSGTDGIELPDKKFLIVQNESTYENPYGFANLSSCFWPATFKKGGLKFWAIFVEKYGMPHIIGKLPRGATQQEKDDMLVSLDRMVQDAIAVIPDDGAVDIKDPAGKGDSSALYKTFMDAMNSEISKALLGQTLSTEVGDKGSYAAAQTHMQVREDIVESDQIMVEEAFNQLIGWLVDYNFGEGVERPEFFMYAEKDVNKAVVERDKVLKETHGVRFKKQYFVKAYNIEEEDFDIVEPDAKPAGPQFAEDVTDKFPDQAAIDDMLDKLPADELAAQGKALLAPVIKLVQESSNFEEVLEKLHTQFATMDTKSIEKLLARAMFVAEVHGRDSVRKENS
ncbi:MAG TPA: DUF935 family protein [bacterium]|nr:DUF935 family protein [bacterium]